MARAWAALLEDVDVVLCPVSPVPSLPHDPEPAEVDSVDRRLSRTIEVDGRTRPYLDQLTWNVVVGMAGARDRFDQAIALEGVQGTGVR